jgi:hypothetical protein
VRGRFALDWYTVPVLAVNVPARLRVDVPLTALALLVSVNVRVRIPADVMPGVPHDAVMPFGRPEGMLMLDQPALLRTAPPVGVAVTVTVADERGVIERVCGERANTTPGAGCTCNAMLLLADTPSPETVTTTVAEDAGAAADAVRISVSLFVLTPPGVAAGLADHLAETPDGRALTE